MTQQRTLFSLWIQQMRSSSIIILFVASLDSTDLIYGLTYQRAFLVGTLQQLLTQPLLFLCNSIWLHLSTLLVIHVFSHMLLCSVSYQSFTTPDGTIRLISTNISHILLIRRTEWMIPPVLGIHWLVSYFHRLCILVAPGNKDDLVLHRYWGGPPAKI